MPKLALGAGVKRKAAVKKVKEVKELVKKVKKLVKKAEGGLAPMPPYGGAAKKKRAPRKPKGGLAGLPVYGAAAKKKRAPRKAKGGLSLPMTETQRVAAGAVKRVRRVKGYTTKGVLRKVAPPSARQLAYREFVRMHIGSAPGSNQKEKMAYIGKEWKKATK